MDIHTSIIHYGIQIYYLFNSIHNPIPYQRFLQIRDTNTFTIIQISGSPAAKLPSHKSQ